MQAPQLENRLHAVPVEVSRTAVVKNEESQEEDSGLTWKQRASACAEQDLQLRKAWKEPDYSTFKLRGMSYLRDRVKITAEPTLLELVWVDVFRGTREELMHTSKQPKSFMQKLIAKHGSHVPPLFVINLLVPGSPLVACVQYFMLKPHSHPSERTQTGLDVWQKFWNGTNEERRTRLKLIPGIAEGPWVVKKSVGAKPFILSNVLKIEYFKGECYLEAVVDVSSDRIAKSVTSLCRSHASALTVDMGFVLEGKDDNELPESLLCCARLDHLNIKHAAPIAD